MKCKKSIKSHIRQSITLIVLILCGLHVSAAIGIGGGEKKKKNMGIEFTPISITNSFTLKSNLSYKGSKLLSEPKVPEILSFNSVVAYQQGNTTYILPYKSSVAISPSTGNLQMLNFKVNIHK